MQTDILTATAIKKLKPKEKVYTKNDGAGLSLEIPPVGSKRWRFRYRFNGKPKNKSLGIYPDVTLADARKKRSLVRNSIANGIDPFAKKEKVQGVSKRTFKECADLFAEKILSKQSDAHYKRTVNGWKRDVFTQDTTNGKKDSNADIRIGDTFINDITADDIKAILVLMRDRDASESARKVFSSIHLVFQYIIAVQTDKDQWEKVTRNPCNDISLKFLLGEHVRKHYPIITDSNELGALLNNIDAYPGDISVKLALRMIAHTFVRPINIRLADWSEVDLKTKRWTIPATKMKTKQDLIIPLSNQVLQILEEAKEFSGEEGLIFPSPKSKTQPLSDAALVSALRRLGYSSEEIVAHSFRGIFSTIAHEEGKFKHEVIETQLAHSVGNAVSKAYNRAVHLPKRTKMMQWYSNLLEEYKSNAVS